MCIKGVLRLRKNRTQRIAPTHITAVAPARKYYFVDIIVPVASLRNVRRLRARCL